MTPTHAGVAYPLTRPQAWQRDNESTDHARFPRDLERARLTVLTKGQCAPRQIESMGLLRTAACASQGRTLARRARRSLLLPAGWIHAVYTTRDSCVLGWNWTPLEQLSTALPILRNHWGSKTHEIRQKSAFKMTAFGAAAKPASHATHACAPHNHTVSL